MKLFSERDDEARALRRKVRWFLTIIALLGVLTLIVVAVRQGAFTQTIPLHFFAESARDINKGMAVKVIGYKIGKVEEVSIEPDNRIKVRIGINDDYSRLIPLDSVARVSKEGLIGTSVVDIHPGHDKTRTVAANDVLRFERDSGLSDLANKLADQIIPILQDVKQITASINDPQGGIRQAVRNIGEATLAIRGSSQELEKLLHQGNAKVGLLSGQVTGVLDRTDQNLVLVHKSLATLDQTLPGMLKKVDGTLENIREISRDGAAQLPGLLRDGKAVADEAREIVSGARKTWPIRALVEPSSPDPLPLDSYVPPSTRPR